MSDIVIAGIAGSIGVFFGTVVTGIFNILSNWVNNCSKNELTKKEQEFKTKQENFSRLSYTFSEAINAAIDCMHATWIRNAIPREDPNYFQAFLTWLHAWGRTWKSSAELRMYLEKDIAKNYDEIVEELQALKIEDLTVDSKNQESEENYNAKIQSLIGKAEKLFAPYKDILKV